VTIHTPGNLATALVVETGELLKHLQWRDDEDIVHAATDNPAAISEGTRRRRDSYL
jgi:hypothetical protein